MAPLFSLFNRGCLGKRSFNFLFIFLIPEVFPTRQLNQQIYKLS
jgi:hypothetical protein